MNNPPEPRRQLNDLIGAAAATALPAQIRSFLKDVRALDVVHAKALLQPILSDATVYKDGRIELAFR